MFVCLHLAYRSVHLRASQTHPSVFQLFASWIRFFLCVCINTQTCPESRNWDATRSHEQEHQAKTIHSFELRPTTTKIFAQTQTQHQFNWFVASKWASLRAPQRQSICSHTAIAYRRVSGIGMCVCVWVCVCLFLRSALSYCQWYQRTHRQLLAPSAQWTLSDRALSVSITRACWFLHR